MYNLYIDFTQVFDSVIKGKIVGDLLPHAIPRKWRGSEHD